MEFLFWSIGYYFFCGISLYTYSVIKTKEYLGFWTFNIDKEYVGIMKYPRWTLFWLEWSVRKIKWIFSIK